MAKLFNWFVRARDKYFALPRFQFEAVTLGICGLIGVLVMPALIYLPGRALLKEYANGNVLALYLDVLKGLIELRPSCWIAIAGPYAFVSVFRLFRLILRKI